LGDKRTRGKGTRGQGERGKWDMGWVLFSITKKTHSKKNGKLCFWKKNNF
jgi:hypothetical protein